MEEEKMDTTPQGHKMSLESLSKEEVINKYKGLLVIAKKAKHAKDEIAEENRLLKEQLQQHETQKEADKNALMTMKEMLEAYTENKLELTTQVTELQKLRKNDSENLEKLSIENESLKRQMVRLTEDNESLLRDIENMESQLQQVSCLGKEQKQHLFLLEQEIEQLKQVENKHHEMIIKNDQILKELKELKEKYKFIKDINTEQRQKFNSLKDRFIEVLRKLKKLKECKRILLETQHEYADSVSQWQHEIIQASKVLCKELNNLKEENSELLKKLGSKQSNYEGNDFNTMAKLNELMELSEKAIKDYRNLQKENLELKQKVDNDTNQCGPKISSDKLNEIWHLSKTAFQDYQNIKEENLQLKDKAKSIKDHDQVDDQLDFVKCNELTLKLEDLQILAAKAYREFQEKSKELNQIKLDYEKIQLYLEDNKIIVKDFEEKRLQVKQILEKHEKEFESLKIEFQNVHDEKLQLQAELDKISISKMHETEIPYQVEEEILQVKQSLDKSLNLSQKESKDLQENLQSLLQDKQSLEKSLNFSQKECKDLQENLETLLQDKLKNDNDYETLLKAQKSLQDSLDKCHMENQALTKENSHLKEQLHELSENDSASTIVLKEQLLIAQQSSEEYQQMYKQNEIEHRELLDEMRELNEALKARGDLISRQQEEHHVLKADLKSNAERLAKIQQELDQKDQQLNEKLAELVSITKVIDNFKEKIEHLENSSSLNEEKVRVLSAELEALKTNQPLNDFDNQSDVQSTSTISRADELQRLREVEDSFEDKYNKLRGLAAKLKKKLQEETSNKQRLEKEIQDLKSQETDMKTQLEAYTAKVLEMETLQKQLNDKQKHVEALKTENQKLKSSRKQANVLNLEIEAAEKSLTDVTNKLANRSSDLDAAQESIKSKDSTILQLRKEIELLESSKASEVMHSQELKQQIDHLQKTTKDEMHSKQLAYEKSKILEQDVENLKLELENVKVELAQTTSKQEMSLKTLKTEKEQLSTELSATQETLLASEQKLKQTERSIEDLRVEYLDYKVKAQAVLRKNQTRDSSKERELEEEIVNMRAAETQLKTNIQTLTTKLEAFEKQKDLLNEDNNNLEKRCNELMLLIEDVRSQNDSLSREIQQQTQQQHETLKQHRQQIESIDICHKEQLQSLNSRHLRQLDQLKMELSAQIRQPPSVGATKSIPTYQQSFIDHVTDQSKLDFLLMEREDAEGSEEAAETLANLAASRKISNDSSSKRSTHDFMPLDELLNTPMNAIHSDTLITATQQHQVSDNALHTNNTLDILQLELNTTKERLQKQESRARHLTSLLAENEQDLAKLTQMNDMLKEELRRQERSVEREQHMHNSEYVKNVIMKFLTLNNVDEKTRLVPVICTILKLTRPETDMLNCVAKGQKVSEPPQRQGGWSNFLPWGSNNNNSNTN